MWHTPLLTKDVIWGFKIVFHFHRTINENQNVPAVGEGWSSVAGPPCLAYRALELGQVGWEGRRKGSGLRALGLFLAVEMWDCGRRHKYSLKQVVDSEVLTRVNVGWICLWMDLLQQLHTFTCQSPGFHGAPLSDWVSFAAASEVSPGAPTPAILVPFFLSLWSKN